MWGLNEWGLYECGDYMSGDYMSAGTIWVGTICVRGLYVFLALGTICVGTKSNRDYIGACPKKPSIKAIRYTV